MVTETLAAILSGARSRLGWSLRDAERATGVPNAHLSQLETGKIGHPGIGVLVKLAKAYGIPVRRLTEAAGHGSDWSLACDLDEGAIRASERERIRQLAIEHGATYRREHFHSEMDGPRRLHSHDAPFADLIGDET